MGKTTEGGVSDLFRDFLLSQDFENGLWADAMKAKIADMAAAAIKSFQGTESKPPDNPFNYLLGMQQSNWLADAQRYNPYAYQQDLQMSLGRQMGNPLFDLFGGLCGYRCQCCGR